MDLKKLIVESIKIDKESFDFFYDISNIYSDMGSVDKAINIKEILLSLTLDNVRKEEIMLSLAKDFHKAGMYDNAISILEEVFLITDNKDAILDMQSHIYSELKEWKRVIDIQKMKKIKNPDFILFALCNYSKEVLDNGDIKRAYLLLKEAELINKNHPHIFLHWVDIYKKEDNLSELLAIGEKISKLTPDFFGIFLDKISDLLDKNFLEMVVKHLKNNPYDYYTLYVFSNYLLSKERCEDVIKILKEPLAKGVKIPALIRLFILCLDKTKEKIHNVYIKSIMTNLPDFTKWFRCADCGQEFEIYSFNCIRCSSIDTLRPLWLK